MKTDAQLKQDVAAELEWDPLIDTARIGVEIKNDIITLAGHLDSYPQKLAAERAAQRVAGVKAVAVEIDVRIPGSSQRTDGDIASAASDALRWNALVPGDRVQLKVEDGWITLGGELDWAYQRSAAETAVRDLVGVRGVFNRIELKPKVSAANVKTKIEAALQRAAHFDADAITVNVEGGKVVLKGRVHSHAERRIVEDATWAAPGVTSVVDQILISD